MTPSRLALSLIIDAFGPAVQDGSATPEQGALYRLARLAQAQARTLDELTATTNTLTDRITDLENDIRRLQKGHSPCPNHLISPT